MAGKNPFSMFSGITRQSALQSDRFNKAVIFPVPADDAKITHGVIVFMPWVKTERCLYMILGSH
jgi:hypothetical protein